ncbi:pentatricopeptide repeat-containing protein At1g06143 [Prosopis cineraria]|uniref:pentatricopeptide repeat-containing protein At1g06143 n=1 Tax=Prosopis cineraria TaxID=364024 RepID=UPI002410A352|nr:pentatricopeptide repeat-containing protein At1g06143 [Prosopis cineraria]
MVSKCSILKHLLQHRYSHTLSEAFLNQLKACSELKTLESIYASMIKTNANQDCFLMNQFISYCSIFSCMDFATSAFNQMESPNTFVYNALIRGSVHCCYLEQAFVYYTHMLQCRVNPASYTFSSLVKASTLLLSSCFGQAIHSHIWKHGFELHVFVQTTLVEFYSTLGDIKGSTMVFDEMCEKDIFAWTTMIKAHVRHEDMHSAQRLFDEMPEKNVATWNTMIDGYTKSRNFESAELLFYQMPSRDIISWTTMMICYSQNQRFRDVISLFHDMIYSGFSPDEVTMATVISACAHLGALDIGREVHLYLMLNGFDLDVYTGSALIDMYAKCGNLDRSLLVFYKLNNKNLFCWNSIIEGLAVHGHAQEALRMFDKMERKGIKPNAITFISVLSACTHAGFVEEGRQRFVSMIQDYCITPHVEHYGCMVDLLSKAGLLEEALDIIRSLAFEPNSVIWGALLNGCKLHRNLEIAYIAVQNLTILEPDNSGYYSLLVNMYAEVTRWSEVAKIRTAMKELGIEKRCPGSSWVEIKKKIHQFAAYDKCHPSFCEVRLVLTELDGQMKLAGCAPELESIS